MEINFHIGPHKTGTTTVQAQLLADHGSEEPETVWYPKPTTMGPGHAELALKMHQRGEHENPLRDLVNRAVESGVEKLIISSENFSVVSDASIEKFAEAMEGHSLALVTTQNSLTRRAASRWQEWVKGRAKESLDESADRILESPGFQPDLIRRFARALNPGSVKVVYSKQSDAPDALTTRFYDALGLDAPRSDAPKALNRSLGLIEVDIIRNFNVALDKHAPDLPGGVYNKLRQRLLNAVQGPEWKKHCPHVSISVSGPLLARVEQRADEIFRSFDDLSSEWQVIEYGDRRSLLV